MNTKILETTINIKRTPNKEHEKNIKNTQKVKLVGFLPAQRFAFCFSFNQRNQFPSPDHP